MTAGKVMVVFGYLLTVKRLFTIISALIGLSMVTSLFFIPELLGINQPYHAQYGKLEKFHTAYTQVAEKGGWKDLPHRNDTLKKEAIDPIIPQLKERLRKEGYDIDSNNRSTQFDAETETALKLFQNNNGLIATGTLDPHTISILNVSIEQRIKQLEINMERWKKFPKDSGKHYILVNVPDFKLAVIEDSISVLSMKVIVGRLYRKTPEFTAQITQVVFNPVWVIPPGILKNDILPRAKKDPSYLKKNHIHVYQQKDGRIKEIPYDSVNLAAPHNYSFIQSAGAYNALGAIKFIFPNKYNVYLHDTPSKELFDLQEPVFSSGCVRVSDAKNLAIYLLKDQEGWNPERIDRIIGGTSTVIVNLEYPIDLFLAYFTSWVDNNGQLQFRKDIYGRDGINIP